MPKAKTFKPLMSTLGFKIFNSSIVQKMAKDLATNMTKAYYKKHNKTMPTTNPYAKEYKAAIQSYKAADKAFSKDWRPAGKPGKQAAVDTTPPGPDAIIDWY
jgi:hypothetical protein